MHLVLDSNEYIFVFGSETEAASEMLLAEIALRPEKYLLSVCRPILDEVARHLSPRQLKDFYAFLQALAVSADERWVVPFENVERYIEKGLKRGDAFVAGYTEWTGADCLISENRADIISRPALFPFEVFTASQFLRRHS